MAIRVTERRLPTSDPHDLGQAAEGDGLALVGFLPPPIAVGTRADYVLFGEAEAERYEWSWRDASGRRVAPDRTTRVGVAAWVPERPGEVRVRVEARAGSRLVAGVSMRQEVRAPRNELEGEPEPLREVVEDLGTYVGEAAAATGLRGVPASLVAATAAFESFRRPRDDSARAMALEDADRRGRLTALLGARYAGRHADEFIRTRELELVAGALDELARGRAPSSLLDNSIGVCQVRPSTLAMTMGLLPWRESVATAVDGEVLRRYLSEVPLDRKVDLFNLLRFPRTNVRACAMHLASLKNRPNRWPAVEAERLAGDDSACEVIATEYMRGPTVTPRDEARPNRYGREVVRLARSRVVRASFG